MFKILRHEGGGDYRMKINIQIKSFPKEAEKLVRIWERHINSINSDLDYITFINKRPKNPRNEYRRIAGLRAKAISYLRDDEELIKMSVENFIYLMAKCGVNIEIGEEKRK